MNEFGAILAHCSPAEVITSRSAAIVRVPSDTAAITAISRKTAARKRKKANIAYVQVRCVHRRPPAPPSPTMHRDCGAATAARAAVWRNCTGLGAASAGQRARQSRAACRPSRLRWNLRIYIRRALRRDGRVAEGARLESVYTGNRIVGSNPTPSARQCPPLFGVVRVPREMQSKSMVLAFHRFAAVCY